MLQQCAYFAVNLKNPYYISCILSISILFYLFAYFVNKKKILIFDKEHMTVVLLLSLFLELSTNMCNRVILTYLQTV